jgi:hypothetical protein
VTTLGWLLTSSASLGLSLGAALLLIPKELWKRWRRRIVDHLDDALRRGVSRFDRRYREFLLSSLRFIDLKGLTTVGFYTPELDEVFVDVSLAYRAPHHVPESMLAELPVEVTDRHSIGHFLDRAQPMVLAVVGVPTTASSTRSAISPARSRPGSPCSSDEPTGRRRSPRRSFSRSPSAYQA